MLAKQTRNRIVGDIAAVGKAYENVHLERNRKEFPKLEEDWGDGLGFFLYGYAFERRGTSSAYPTCSVHEIDGQLFLSFPAPGAGATGLDLL